MDTQIAGVPPQTAQAAPTTVPAAAPASSLPTQDKSFSDRAKSISSAAELRKLTAEFLSQPPPPPQAAPLPTGNAPVETAPAPAPEATPAPEPAAEPEATPAPETEPATPPAESEPEADGPVPIPDAHQIRVRLQKDDEEGRLAAAYLKRNADWTMAQAMEAARKQLGVTTQKPDEAKAPEGAPKSDLPQTVAETEAATEKLLDDRQKALDALDYESFGKIDRTIRKLDAHKVALERQSQERQAQQLARYNQQFDASLAQATELYEFAKNENSPGALRMREIEQELKATGSPLYDSADKPLKIAHMVAAELNIAPRRKGAAPAPAKPAAVPAPKKQVLPGGQTVPVAPQKPAIEAKIQGVKTVHDLRRVQEEFLGRQTV